MDQLGTPLVDRNVHRAFDDLLNERLGFYVYGLFDPETGQPFYIGKGGGKEARGNRRVLAHFTEAQHARDTGTVTGGKVARIRAIWDRGQDVVWKVLRRGIPTEEEAHRIEGALIDTLRASGIALENEQGGHHGQAEGLLDMEDVYVLGATDLDPIAIPDSLIEVPIFVFNITKGFRERQDLRLATTGYWDVRGKFAGTTGAILLGAIGGVSRSVIGLDRWIPSEMPGKSGKPGNRSIALERSLLEAEIEPLLRRNLRVVIEPCAGFWARGGFLVFEVTKDRKIRIRRGLGTSSIEETA